MLESLDAYESAFGGVQGKRDLPVWLRLSQVVRRAAVGVKSRQKRWSLLFFFPFINPQDTHFVCVRRTLLSSVSQKESDNKTRSGPSILDKCTNTRDLPEAFALTKCRKWRVKVLFCAYSATMVSGVRKETFLTRVNSRKANASCWNVQQNRYEIASPR